MIKLWILLIVIISLNGALCSSIRSEEYRFKPEMMICKGELCDELNSNGDIEIKDVVCNKLTRFSNTEKWECSSPFNDNEDYDVRSYYIDVPTHSFINYYYGFTPKLRYSKYLTEEQIEECEWQDSIHFMNRGSYGRSCYDLFYRTKTEFEESLKKQQEERIKCQQAWKAWTHLSTKGYNTDRFSDVSFLHMVKKKFHNNLIFIEPSGFQFETPHGDSHMTSLCTPDSVLSSCQSFFEHCEDPDYDNEEWYYKPPPESFKRKYQFFSESQRNNLVDIIESGIYNHDYGETYPDRNAPVQPPDDKEEETNPQHTCTTEDFCSMDHYIAETNNNPPQMKPFKVTKPSGVKYDGIVQMCRYTVSEGKETVDYCYNQTSYDDIYYQKGGKLGPIMAEIIVWMSVFMLIAVCLAFISCLNNCSQSSREDQTTKPIHLPQDESTPKQSEPKKTRRRHRRRRYCQNCKCERNIKNTQDDTRPDQK